MAQTTTHFSCTMSNIPTFNAKTKQLVDDWTVSCKITEGDKVVWGPKALVLPQHASYAEAMTEIDRWRKEDEPTLVKKKVD
jgi:hypothetical protein